MASWCWFMAARLRTGRSWLSLQLGSAPCRVGKGTNSHKSLRFVAPPRPPSSKSLVEVNCLTQERGEAGSPGPALKTELSGHMGDGLEFLSPPVPHPAGGPQRDHSASSGDRKLAQGHRPWVLFPGLQVIWVPVYSSAYFFCCKN